MNAALNKDEIESKISKLSSEWKFGNQQLEQTFRFEDFSKALQFVNNVAELSDIEMHYPVVCINYDQVNISLWTHASGGLTAKDFELASRIESLFDSRFKRKIY